MTAQETIAAAISKLEAVRFTPADVWADGTHSAAKRTLRRSVEAQIAILRQAHAELEPFNGMRLNADAVQHELDLARAILGEA